MSGFFKKIQKEFKWGEVVVHAKIDLLDSFSLKKIKINQGNNEESIHIDTKTTTPECPTYIQASNNEYLFYDDIVRCDFILNKYQEN